MLPEECFRIADLGQFIGDPQHVLHPMVKGFLTGT